LLRHEVGEIVASFLVKSDFSLASTLCRFHSASNPTLYSAELQYSYADFFMRFITFKVNEIVILIGDEINFDGKIKIRHKSLCRIRDSSK